MKNENIIKRRMGKMNLEETGTKSRSRSKNDYKVLKIEIQR